MIAHPNGSGPVSFWSGGVKNETHGAPNPAAPEAAP